MAFDYAGLQSIAAGVITEFGSAVTFKYESDQVLNKSTGAIITPATENTIAASAVASNYDKKEIDGESIQAGDMKLISENISSEPQVGWTVTVDGRDWHILDVKLIKPASTNVIYICQIRI